MWWRNKICTRAIAVVLMGLALSACGFHLRGAGDLVPWPAALKSLRIEGAVGTQDVRDELARRLRERYGVALGDTQSGPVLQVIHEQFERRALELTLTGKALGYLLRLRVEAQVRNAAGQIVVPRMMVFVQRDFSYDSAQVLAMNDEQQRLKEAMVRDAARQLITRIATLYPKKATP